MQSIRMERKRNEFKMLKLKRHDCTVHGKAGQTGADRQGTAGLPEKE
jgi:hypothetical protein